MRLFPRAPRQRLLAALVVGVVLAGGSTVPSIVPRAQADDQQDLEQQQKSVQGQIESQSSDLEKSTAEVSASSAALLDAQQQLGDARLHLATVQEQLEAAIGVETQTQAKLVQTRATLATARQQLSAGQAAVAVQRAVVADTISSIYEQGDPQLLAFASILDAQTPADITRQMGFKDVVVDKQDSAYDALREQEIQLAATEAQVEQAEADVAEQHDEAREHVADVRDLQQQAAAAESQVTSLVDTRQQAKAAAVDSENADQQALADLQAENAAIKKKILAAKKAAEEAAKAARKQSYVGPSDGLLLAPVTGPVTSPFGYRIHPIYGYWGLHDGTDFGVACGEGLRAAGDGKVLETYYSSVYGNRLFLDLGIVNGKAITVVYNHMSGYNASVGDVVKRGDIVGYVGSTGWSTGCHLHFTVLEDGTAVDPMTYL